MKEFLIAIPESLPGGSQQTLRISTEGMLNFLVEFKVYLLKFMNNQLPPFISIILFTPQPSKLYVPNGYPQLIKGYEQIFEN